MTSFSSSPRRGSDRDEGGAVHELELLSTSRATDSAYLAARDIARVAGQLQVPYRLVGGNCVTLLVAIHQVRGVPARDTADADLGVNYDVAADPRLPAALISLGYAQAAGNRFVREHPDDVENLQLSVDVLAPAFQARMLTNQRHGELVVDEIPGLALALNRPGVAVDIRVQLTSGNEVATRLMLADPVSALCMKAAAWSGRFAARDAIDIWRLLETAHAAGVRSESWPMRASGLDAARVLNRCFGTPASNAFRSASVPSHVGTRVRALVSAVVGRVP